MVIDSEGKLKETQIGDWNKFWKNKKNWWESQAKKTTTKKIKQPEWWMEYSEIDAKGFASLEVTLGGRTFGPLSTKPEKVTTGKKDSDVKPMTMSTWSYY